jgi:hypothetical protein
MHVFGTVPRVEVSRYALFEQPWPDGDYRFFQLGFHVDDVVAAAERWASVVGVGPFSLTPRTTSSAVFRGRPCRADVQIAVAQAGPVQIELVHQFDDEPSIYRELYPAAGNGLHQLCAMTARYDDTKARYEALGYEVAGEVEAQGFRVAYVDTVAAFGFYTEVIDQNPAYLRFAARLAGLAEGWDGTDPVRILTRDGYRTP